MEILLNFTAPSSKSKPASFGIKVFRGKDEETVISYQMKNNTLMVDRKMSSISYPSKRYQKLPEIGTLHWDDGFLTLQIFLDWSSLELFANGGKLTISDRVFPKVESNELELFSQGGDVHIQNLTIYRLESIWDGHK